MAKKIIKKPILPPFIAAIVIIALFTVLVGTTLYYWKRSIHHTHKTIVDDSDNEATGTDDSEIVVAQPLPINVSMTLPKDPVQQKMLVTGDQISLGTSIQKTGELGLLGRTLSDGIFLCLNKVNTVDGGAWKTHRLSLDQRDDSGQVYRATPHIHDLLNKTPFFFSPSGEIVFEKVYIPLLARNALALFFPYVGMRSQVTKGMPVVWFRPPYRQEIRALLDYLISVLKQDKIALFYEESTWGIEAKRAAEDILLRRYSIKPCGSAPYQPNTVMVQQAVIDIKKSSPQAIICLANGRPTYNFIREAINQQLHYATFLGLSRTAHIAPQLQASRGIGLITSSVVPNPYNSQLPIVQEYRKYMQQYLPNKGLSSESLEGYIAASLFVYFLEQCPKTVTVAQLLDRIAQSGEMLFKGLHLKYKNKTLSWSVWINKGSDVAWDEYRDRS